MLATRCPWCETVFRLSKEQAGARKGMVRCGACRQTFNSLDHLVEDAHLEELGAATEPMIIDPAEAETSALMPDWSQPAPAVRTASEPAFEPAVADDTTPALAEHDFRPSVSFLKGGDKRRMSVGTRILLGFLCVMLVVALALQLLYRERDLIAARMPSLHGPLAQMCIALHCRLQLPAQLDALVIEGKPALEALPNNPNVLVLSFTLHNRSETAQQLPYVELSLTAGENDVLVRRVLSPKDYQPQSNRTPDSEGIAAGGEVAARAVLDATGIKATDFHVLLFYP